VQTGKRNGGATNVAEPDVIDRAVLDGLLDSLGGDREFLAELLETYFDDAPNLLATMHAALAVGDAEAFRRAAHSLKSNSANFGAMVLSRMCKELEDMGKAGTLDGAGERLDGAEAEYARVQPRLEALTA
jgi:HPt (histidine-containing phosphotransfer) domain-containing protein